MFFIITKPDGKASEMIWVLIVKEVIHHIRSKVLTYPLVNIPSGKIHPCLMGKSTISMAMFHSFLYIYQAGYFNHTSPEGVWSKSRTHDIRDLWWYPWAIDDDFYVISIGFLWISMGFLWDFHGISMGFLLISLGFLLIYDYFWWLFTFYLWWQRAITQLYYH